MKITKADLSNLKEIIKSIKKGKVVVCPTDTVYGLICDATNEKAVEKLFGIKKRFKRKPIPIFVKDIKMAKKFAEIGKNQEKFLRKVWFTRPNFKETWTGKGKVTVVLKVKKKKILPKGILSSENKIGIRIPDCKLVNILLEKLNFPLTGTSANISGRSPSTEIKKVLRQFEKEKIQPDLVLDVGNLKKAKPSTVIDLTNLKPKIIRRGQIKKQEIMKIIKSIKKVN